MPDRERIDAIKSFLVRAQFFVSALNEVVDARVLHEIAGEDFTVYQLQLLRLVSVKNDQSIGSLAAHLGVSNPAMSKAVERLVQRMFLHRSDTEQDRRRVQLSVTKMGQQILAKFDAAREKRVEEIFSETSDEELCKTAELLQRISARIIEVA